MPAFEGMQSRGIIVLAALVVLVGGLTLQFSRIRDIKSGDTVSQTRPIGLGERMPLKPKGWNGEDEPLGPNEFIKTAVEKNLNYDDVVNRIYRGVNGSFGLYAAYWSPGRMPVQKVASHTPDRCWSENGWTCDSLRSGAQVPWQGGALKPAYWRSFSAPGAKGSRQYVLYWHLVGGELYDYGTGFNQRPSPLRWWRETVHYALKGSAEQYFIRLTSNRPFEEIWHDPGFQEVLTALARLGLAEG